MDRNEATSVIQRLLTCRDICRDECCGYCETCRYNTEYDEKTEALKLAIAALDKDTNVPNKWISVSERLPEISEKDVYGNVTFSKPVWACMKYGDGFTWQGIDQYTTNNGGGWFSEVPFDDSEECSKVIAWMPLPEPWKGNVDAEIQNDKN